MPELMGTPGNLQLPVIEPWIRIQLLADLGDFLLQLELNRKEKQTIRGDGMHEVEKTAVF